MKPDFDVVTNPGQYLNRVNSKGDTTSPVLIRSAQGKAAFDYYIEPYYGDNFEYGSNGFFYAPKNLDAVGEASAAMEYELEYNNFGQFLTFFAENTGFFG